jgi:hypothetical protein
VMKRIITDLTMAGYAHAMILLEILTRYEDGGVKFKLPLRKATDLKFWAQEFHLKVPETEHTFDVFEEAGLILPWRKKQIICAPILRELLDTWSKAKLKQKGKKQKELTEDSKRSSKSKRERESNSNSTSKRLQSDLGVGENPNAPFLSPSDSKAQAAANAAIGQEIEQRTEDLAVELSYKSDGDITFDQRNLGELVALMRLYSSEEITSAFESFYEAYEGDPRWAAKQFVETASQIILVARKRAEAEAYGAYEEFLWNDLGKESMAAVV